MKRRLILLFLPALLTACDMLGLPDPKASAAEGKAIGAACRQAGRALEDCYQLNPGVPKAAVFDGWREMNDYMTEQKLDIVRPTLPPVLPKALRSTKKPPAEDGAASSRPASTGDAPTTSGQSMPAASPKAAG